MAPVRRLLPALGQSSGAVGGTSAPRTPALRLPGTPAWQPRLTSRPRGERPPHLPALAWEVGHLCHRWLCALRSVRQSPGGLQDPRTKATRKVQGGDLKFRASRRTNAVPTPSSAGRRPNQTTRASSHPSRVPAVGRSEHARRPRPGVLQPPGGFVGARCGAGVLTVSSTLDPATPGLRTAAPVSRLPLLLRGQRSAVRGAWELQGAASGEPHLFPFSVFLQL